MLVSAAVCPHPPALVPVVSQGAAGRLADPRAACIDVVRRLGDADPDVLVCIGAGPETRRWGGDAGGSLAAFGVDVRFGGAEVELPLSLTIGAYLIEAAGSLRCDVFQAVSSDWSADGCRALGAELADVAARVALLVMGDGSAKRNIRSPGYFDDRAEVFDAAVSGALSAPSPEALLEIDAALADDLWVAGRPSWQALAGAILASSTEWSGRLAYAQAPLGVGYIVVHLWSA